MFRNAAEAGPPQPRPFDVSRGYDSTKDLIKAISLHSAESHRAVRRLDRKKDGYTHSSKAFYLGCAGDRSKCGFHVKGFRERRTGQWFPSPQTDQGPPIFTHDPLCTSRLHLPAAHAAAHPAIIAAQATSQRRMTIKQVKEALSEVLPPCARSSLLCVPFPTQRPHMHARVRACVLFEVEFRGGGCFP